MDSAFPTMKKEKKRREGRKATKRNKLSLYSKVCDGGGKVEFKKGEKEAKWNKMWNNSALSPAINRGNRVLDKVETVSRWIPSLEPLLFASLRNRFTWNFTVPQLELPEAMKFSQSHVVEW